MITLNTSYTNRRITDAHVHFWDLSKMSYPWLDEVPAIKKSLGLPDYETATEGIAVSNIIFLQCECLPSEYQTEVDYITQLATHDRRISGIVAYYPLEAADAAEKLQVLIANKLVKGIRRLEEDFTSLYSNPLFVSNMGLLHQYKLSFDLGVKANQLPAAVKLVQAAPDVRYMLDHFGKPAIRTQAFTQWKHHMMELAKNPQVYCKLSGLVTEADWNRWTIADLQRYVDLILEFFGPKRIAFGSDWPVVTLASSYGRWFDTALQLCHKLAPDDLDHVFYQNALDFYQIEEYA
ncbi:amidohydrolase [Parapedobacter pyrenivorans]|uniref:Amidohydrolase n=1 Tax=Parapedobacter pyrenivorans TaxID=1305674 RepID=A0A917M2F2_9SPHI|nr:amidohydrolase family protein [Parapedobacter pyrenivorans]GGG73594.1 amidohydrolase [Parapedobacter pyrenivorans]